MSGLIAINTGDKSGLLYNGPTFTRIITTGSAQTWAKPPCNFVYMEWIGGGGAGGGGANATDHSAGGGGGAAFNYGFFDGNTFPNVLTINIAAKTSNAGQGNPGSDGVQGNNTTITGTNLSLTGYGGGGGAGG